MSKIMMPSCLIGLLLAACFCGYAQDPKAAIQQKLVSQYALTQPTAANDDIVTAGAVLVLKKGPLMMVDATNSVNPYPTTYKDGKMKNGAAKAKSFLGGLSSVPGFSSVPGASQANGGPGTRTFVPGEKMWVTGIDVRDNGVIFSLFTDAYSDVRYKTTLTFAFPKSGMPPAEQVEKLVAEVFDVQPADDANAKGQQSAAPAGQPAAAGSAQPAQAASAAQPVAPQQPQEAAPPPIAPPPPAPADPKTIALKQTTEQVIANFGQPEKIIKLGTKEIYVYKDMKVTFVGGKVTDVQ